MHVRTAIVFLDIDGVLISHAYWRRRAEAGRTETPQLDDLDREAVARLNRLCEEGRANVVVTSTKRLTRSRVQLQEWLGEHGFKHLVLGKTPDYTRQKTPGGLWRATERGNEIQGWLDESEQCYVTSSFVILDDDSDMAHLRRIASCRRRSPMDSRTPTSSGHSQSSDGHGR